MSREIIKRVLKDKFKVSICGNSEEFNDSQGGLWVSIEEGSLSEISYDMSRFDDMFKESDVNKYLGNVGWFLELYDPGTALIYPIEYND